MKYLVILLIVFYSASARKEEFDGLEELMNNPKLLAQLEKRLGALLSADEPDSGKSDRSETELPCNASTGTLNATQARCSFETDNGQIIRTTDSINNGAKFVGKMENIECAKECVMECCNNPECDTAVYQDKDDHKCYLFNCDSNCVFDRHSNYRVSYFKSRSVTGNPGSVPDGNHRSHETELENLGSHPAAPEPLATVPPTEESLTTTVRPALGESCRYFGPTCEDQHAECYMRECSCRAGYHEKYGICRKHCRAEEFECDNEGLGAEATQCVHSTYRCDGKKDCEDRSDEYNCPKIDEGYKGLPASNVYQKQLFPYPYNNYGYQVPGLANQQSAGSVLPANQIYQNQAPASGIQNGQYYIPGLTNQNSGQNIPQSGGSQINSWPFMDKAGVDQPPYQNIDQPAYQNIDQSAYQNNVPYQKGHQQNSISNPNVPPLVQSPSSNIQKAPIQSQHIDQHRNLNPIGKQSGVVDNNRPALAPGRIEGTGHVVKPTKMVPLNRPIAANTVEAADKSGYHGVALEKGQDQQAMNHPTNYHLGKQFHILGESGADSDYLDEVDYSSHEAGDSRGSVSGYDTFDDQTKSQMPKPSGHVMGPKKGTQTDITENDPGNEDGYNRERFRPGMGGQRHSAEAIDDMDRGRTYPPSTKSKSQIEKPTQSTVPGQKTGQNQAYASERIDFPIWMQYDGNSQNINAKKGEHFEADNIPQEADMKSDIKPGPKPSASLDQRPSDTEIDKNIDEKGKIEADAGQKDAGRNYKYNGYDFDDSGRFPTHNNPSDSRDRLPDSYRGRYRDRYHRPSQDSRYPYYDNQGYRGRDRYHYPVWDSYREEYYYPDNYENRKGGSSHGLDYEDYRTENHLGHLTDNKDPDHYKPKGAGETSDHADKTPVVAQPSKQTEDKDIDTQGAPSPDKNSQDSDTKSAQGPKVPEVPQSHVSDDTITTLAPGNDHQVNTGAGSQLPDEASKNSNTSESEESKDSFFTYFSAEEKVESYTDGSQGPIVALALGLAITLILLIFVGCRLRTVKRRLRKGRALHSNEADYLINGMYL